MKIGELLDRIQEEVKTTELVDGDEYNDNDGIQIHDGVDKLRKVLSKYLEREL